MTTNLLHNAILFATSAHWGQDDKAGHPYILHPLAVMEQMITEDEKIVAILHDVVEDCEHITLLDLTGRYYDHIIKAVDAITKRDNECIEDYIKRVLKNKLARAVKLEDIRHNMSKKRMNVLSEKTQIRLKDKYRRCLELLGS